MATVTISIPIIFNAKPALAISGIRKYPEPNTTAFGGVATGSINAQDAATPAAIISANGWNPSATANAAIIGNIIDAVAVFDVISVKNMTKPTTIAITSSKLTPCNPESWDPIHSDNPDSTKPAAIAKPPPNNSKIPHGNLTAVSQSNKKSPRLLTDGITNNKTANEMAITPSLMPGINSCKRNERVIHESAASVKTVKTSFSSVDARPSSYL